MTERKTEILDVAEELLLSRGYCAFSYQDIADRLGIRKASLHHHFATKEDLGVALCETERLAVDKDRLSPLRHAPGPWLIEL